MRWDQASSRVGTHRVDRKAVLERVECFRMPRVPPRAQMSGAAGTLFNL